MENEIYKTSDFQEVIVLSLFLPIMGHETEGSRVIFHFGFTDELQEILNQYFNKQIRVEPNQLFMQMRNVRSIIKKSV